MHIVIATPLRGTQPGGPGMYAVHLQRELEAQGCGVTLIAFGDVIGYPPMIRHILFCVRIYRAMRGADAVIVLDTWSVALPTMLAGALRRKNIILRIGGDYVWEHYVGRTRDRIRLSEFYTKSVRLSFKERCIMYVQRSWIFPRATVLVFCTPWLRVLWEVPYSLSHVKSVIIENAYRYERHVQDTLSMRDRSGIVWVGRTHPLKNVETLDRAVDSIRSEYPFVVYEKLSNIPHEDVLKRIATAVVLVIPSLSEVSPNLAFEALSYSTPVIVTTDCGVHHVLDGVATWIDPENVSSIADALKLYLDPKTGEAMFGKARAFSTERTYRIVAEDFMRILTDIKHG